MIDPSRIMVALDVDELEQARLLIDEFQGSGVTFKVGNQLGTFEGWHAIIQLVKQSGAKIFCDTKFKDIPETVKKSARAITRLEPDFFNIMADTDPQVLRAAVEGIDSAVKDFGVKQPILLGVTVLTSFSDETSQAVYGANSEVKVLQFASAAAASGLNGVVCSAKEASILRANPATKDLILVTPGIRPLWAASGDQSRVMTPTQAIEVGADYLVIGRPITQPPETVGTPMNALAKIIEEISNV